MSATGALHKLFSQSRVFEGLEAEQIDFLVHTLRERSFDRGEILFKEGEQGDSLAVVEHGGFRIEVSHGEDHRVQVGEIGPGDVIGEMACVDPAARSATVVATEPSRVLEMDRATLSILKEKAPKLFSSVIGGVIARTTDRLRGTNRRVEGALSDLGMAPTVPQMEAVTGKERALEAPKTTRSDTSQLRRLKSLKGFSDPELNLLIKVAPERTFADGETVFDEGNVGNTCLVVLEGEVEIVKSIGGRERRLAILGSGSFVGQSALVDNSPRQATVRASGDLRVLEFSRHNFERLLAAQAPLAIRFQELLARAGIRQLRMANVRLTGALDRLEDLQARAEREEARAKAEAIAQEHARREAEAERAAEERRRAAQAADARRPAPAEPEAVASPSPGGVDLNALLDEATATLGPRSDAEAKAADGVPKARPRAGAPRKPEPARQGGGGFDFGDLSGAGADDAPAQGAGGEASVDLSDVFGGSGSTGGAPDPAGDPSAAQASAGPALDDPIQELRAINLDAIGGANQPDPMPPPRRGEDPRARTGAPPPSERRSGGRIPSEPIGGRAPYLGDGDIGPSIDPFGIEAAAVKQQAVEPSLDGGAPSGVPRLEASSPSVDPALKQSRARTTTQLPTQPDAEEEDSGWFSKLLKRGGKKSEAASAGQRTSPASRHRERSRFDDTSQQSPDQVQETMAFVYAALNEWGMQIEDVDKVRTSVPDGVVKGSEIKSRGRG
jgi:CRP-like cAMP-binding protein